MKYKLARRRNNRIVVLVPKKTFATIPHTLFLLHIKSVNGFLKHSKHFQVPKNDHTKEFPDQELF